MCGRMLDHVGNFKEVFENLCITLTPIRGEQNIHIHVNNNLTKHTHQHHISCTTVAMCFSEKEKKWIRLSSFFFIQKDFTKIYTRLVVKDIKVNEDSLSLPMELSAVFRTLGNSVSKPSKSDVVEFK